ncbi:hypothetical protein UFOVP116_207 [uncultured Caudovirales phage]|uniref:Tail fiber protein n=1 Tax=uncultured Caudovirales phage TaxID=2100421 RepID=A0A6J5L7J2_9CAUD|nr:hypothetical protein UFOVP116_207 [uncultured Caudovirales phage]
MQRRISLFTIQWAFVHWFQFWCSHLIAGQTLISRFGNVDNLVTAIRAELTVAQNEINQVEASIAAIQTRLAANDALDADQKNRITATESRINAVDTAYKAADANLVKEIARVDNDIASLRTASGPGLAAKVNDLIRTQGLQDNLIAGLDQSLTGVVGQLNSGEPTFKQLTVTGKLTVNGTITSINSEVTTIKDPVITLGDIAAKATDGMDRGVEFKYFDKNTAKTGFFGMDTTDKKFKFIPDATGCDNVYGGKAGTIVANIEGTASKLESPITLSVIGDAVGQVAIDGSQNVSLRVEVNGTSDAVSNSLVRRDAAGSAKFTAISTTAKATMTGGIHGATTANIKSELTGFIINGGTF